MSYPTSSKLSPSFWLLIGARKLLCLSAQSEGRTAGTVWNCSGKTMSPGALLAVLYFSSCYIFPPVQTFSRPHYLPLGLRGWGITYFDLKQGELFRKHVTHPHLNFLAFKSMRRLGMVDRKVEGKARMPLAPYPCVKLSRGYIDANIFIGVRT